MSKILKGLTEANSVYGHSDPAREYGADDPVYTKRNRYPQDDTFDDDVAYSRKMYQLGQQQKAAKEKAQRDADHDRLASGTNEEQLDELSNEKLGQYKTAAARDAGKADSEGDYKRGNKRFSGIVKATKKQFANDTKNPVKEDINVVYAKAKALIKQLDESMQQKVIDILKKSVDDEEHQAFKNVNNRVNNPKILGTQNKAKSIYYPLSKPNVKKLDKPLPESLGDQLKSKSIEALQQVKQKIEQQRMADLEQWEKDFKHNTVAKFTARQPSFMQQQPKQVARPLEKHSVLKARLAQLDKAIEKQAVLDKMLQRLDAKGLLTSAIQSDTDTSMLVRDGANDNYVSLNQKLDKALEFVKNRLLTNKAAYAKPKAIDENEELDENLHKWFKEKWVRFGPDGKIRGDCARGDDSEGKPKCLPQSKAHSLGKKGRASAASRKRREDPNPERSGKAINVNTKKTNEEQLDELSCWSGYHRVAGTKAGFPGSCAKNKTNESEHSETCPHCGGEIVSEELMNEKKDACYYKVKSRYKVWPSAYASGALVKCRKSGADSWGNGGKSNESVAEDDAGDVEHRMIAKIEKEKQRLAKLKQTDPEAYKREMAKSKTSSRVPPVSTFEDQGVAEGTDIDARISNLKDAIRFETPRSVPGEDHREQYARHAEKIAGYKAELKKLVAQKKQQGVAEDQLDEKWTKKYKDSINCSNPKGFSQKAHCAGKQKNESAILKGLK